MDELFLSLQKNYQDEPYLSLEQRRLLLNVFKTLLQTNAEKIADAISKDFSYRSADETFFLEVLPSVGAIKYCLEHLKKWMKPRKRHLPWYFANSKAYVFPQPLGVVGVIVPWNYPLYLAIVPAVYALAAGNRVMIKMSELSTHLGALLSSLILASPELNKMISIVNGDVAVAKQFTALPFGHLLFTGSESVGKYIMEAASKNLTPVTLELGGKSPVIVSTSANSALFERIFMGKLFNAGQTCLASDYLLVPEGWESTIEENFKQFMEARYPDLLENTAYSSLISSKSRTNLLAMIDDAQEKGGRIVKFGNEEQGQANKMPVYLVFNANMTMELMQKEIFGPVLPIMAYTTFDDAINLVKSMPKPLALYYFGNNETEKQLIIKNVLSGATTINDTMMHVGVHDLPFGGVGASGMGHYHGQEGFDSFSKLKPVFEQARLSFVSRLYPPYSRFARFLFNHLAGIRKNKHAE